MICGSAAVLYNAEGEAGRARRGGHAASGGGPPTLIDHNPLPELTHADFVQLLGLVLAPENFAPPGALAPPLPAGAPLDWLHAEAKNASVAIANLAGVHSLAAERCWRRQVVLSLDLARLPPDADALLPHADVLFLAPPPPGTSTRDTLLALAPKAAPHALLVLDAGPDAGAALLNVPRREYMQASPWRPAPVPAPAFRGSVRDSGLVSVRDESAFFAGLDSGTADAFPDGSVAAEEEDAVVDAAGARAAFVAGMMWALTRVALPAAEHAPPGAPPSPSPVRGEWELDQCLRFANELAGRKARRLDWDGLGGEMAHGGWFGMA